MAEFTALDAFQIIAALSAAVAATFAIRQSKLTQHQMDNSLRPWVSTIHNGVSLTKHGEMTAILKNYGTLPALKAKIWRGVQLEPFTKEDLVNKPKGETSNEGVIMPDAEKSSTWNIPDYDRIVREKLTISLAMIIEYEYANGKKGSYHLMLRYNPSTFTQESFYENAT